MLGRGIADGKSKNFYNLIGKKYLNKKNFPYGKKINFNSIRKGNFIGELRSACYSPHFKKAIGIAMINEPYCKAAMTGMMEIEGKSLVVKVCDLPFI